MSAETRFVIIANPHTGTNPFIELLNSHPDISCHREVFHWNSVYLKEGTRDDLLKQRNKDKFAFLQKLYNSCSTKACGFKIFMDHDDEILDSVLRDPEVKKVILYRPNLLAVHSSALIVVAKQSWIEVSDNPSAMLDKLAFAHIPKTAGMSLHSALEDHFGKSPTARFGDSAARDRFSEMAADEILKSDYITGHLSTKEMLSKSIDYPTISVVRDPLDRLVSMLRYHRESNLADHRNLKFKDVKSFAEHMAKTGQFNMQCWHLGGTHKFEDAVEMIHRRKLYVAPLDRYEDFLKTLSTLLGSSLMNYQRNVNSRKSFFALSNTEINFLEPLVKEDQKLFEYVQNNYERIKKDFITYARNYSLTKQVSGNDNFGKSDTKVLFDRKEFEKRISAYEKHYKYAIDLLNDTNQEYLFVSYEDDINDSLFRKIFPFLGLEQSSVTRSRSQKMNSSDILSRFENPDEAQQYLAEVGRCHWAQEGFMPWTM